MKKFGLLLLVTGMLMTFSVYGQNLKSKDLRETDSMQRRDLSWPMSRIVINPYNFNSRYTAVQYSNRATMPLNVAYLSTRENDSLPYKDPVTRFSRQALDLLMIYKNTGKFQNAVNNQQAVASDFATEWLPYQLPFSATYSDGSGYVGEDFFYNLYTLVRRIRFDNQGKDSKYYLAGKFQGFIKKVDNALIVNNNYINYAIRFNGDFDLAKTRDGIWYVEIDAAKFPGRELVVSVAFADRGESDSLLLARSLAPLNDDLSKVLADNEKFWDDQMAKFPCPKNYTFDIVDPMGVTPQELQKTYYKAWVFLVMNLLMEDPDIYPYPQLCNGKPSLWDEGAEEAPFTAAWESFFAIQYYAFIDPDVAWDVFKGLMSLVQPDGMLGGESLPSRKAQTAIILYELTGDKESLAEVYPALDRYLNWRMKITHWVYRNLIPVSEYNKDAEFAFSALVDMEHMVTIADILGYKDDARAWRTKHADFLKKCYTWFWPTPDSFPNQNYNIQTGKSSAGNVLWTASGMYIDGLDKRHFNSLYKRFNETFDIDKPFLGMPVPKYPDLSYTVYGLIKHGYNHQAQQMIEVNLRDIVRARASFAEQYVGANFRPDGVRPAMFGASVIIDFVMLLNGYKYDRGIPQGVVFQKTPRGVDNILYRDHYFSINVDPAKEEITYNNLNSSGSKTVKAAGGKAVILK